MLPQLLRAPNPSGTAVPVEISRQVSNPVVTPTLLVHPSPESNFLWGHSGYTANPVAGSNSWSRCGASCWICGWPLTTARQDALAALGQPDLAAMPQVGCHQLRLSRPVVNHHEDSHSVGALAAAASSGSISRILPMLIIRLNELTNSWGRSSQGGGERPAKPLVPGQLAYPIRASAEGPIRRTTSKRRCPALRLR